MTASTTSVASSTAVDGTTGADETRTTGDTGGSGGSTASGSGDGDSTSDGPLCQEREGTTGSRDPSECGDGQITGAEECEDGNLDDFDGCSAGCLVERPVVEISTSGGSTCARFDDGMVKCWGSGWGGQLGLGDTEDRGDEPGEMGWALPRVPLAFDSDEVIRHGDTCVRAMGEVRCWGWPSYGVPGLEMIGDEPGEAGCAVPIDLDGTVVALAPNCAITVEGELFCWGPNADGELGLGDTEARGDDPGELGANLPPVPLPAPIVQADGSSTRCAIDDLGRLKCWGSNEHCELGFLSAGAPLTYEAIGDEPGELEAFDFIDLGSDEPAVDVSAGQDNVCAVLGDGELKCWGGNLHGGVLPFTIQGSWGCGPGEMGDGLPAMDLGADLAVDVEVGSNSACVLLVGGVVKCWGSNTHGKIGGGFGGDTFVPLAEVAPLDLGEPAVAISVTSSSACAVLESGYVKCWGYNGTGQLGYGDTESRGDDDGEMGANLPYVRLF